METINDVVIIGGGIAGLACAKELVKSKLKVTIIEQRSNLGGHVADWAECFPFQMTGQEIVDNLTDDEVKVLTNCTIEKIEKQHNSFIVNDIATRSVVVATGYNLFDATIKEELGYGVYPHVITSEELEKALSENRMPFDTKNNETPRFAIVHCVGSRDLKCGVTHCSKVCCMVGIKAARELKQHYPGCQVTNYYMDLRMFDHGYEELYHEAQTRYNVQFVRGRISEMSHGNQGRIKLKSEDTLLGIPVADRVNGVVLMVGMQPSRKLQLGDKTLPTNRNGFVAANLLNANTIDIDGVFVAGACKGPKTITETLADARSAALEVIEYLKEQKR